MTYKPSLMTPQANLPLPLNDAPLAQKPPFTRHYVGDEIRKLDYGYSLYGTSSNSAVFYRPLAEHMGTLWLTVFLEKGTFDLERTFQTPTGIKCGIYDLPFPHANFDVFQRMLKNLVYIED